MRFNFRLGSFSVLANDDLLAVVDVQAFADRLAVYFAPLQVVEVSVLEHCIRRNTVNAIFYVEEFLPYVCCLV